jgi:hypothetical protein
LQITPETSKRRRRSRKKPLQFEASPASYYEKDQR